MSEIEATTDAPVKQIDESRAAAVKAIEDEIANKKRRAERFGGEYVLTDEDKRRLREARFGVAATTGADVQLPPRKENAPPATGKGSEKGKAAAAKPKPEPRKPLTPEERAAKDAETKAAREKRDAERKAEREQREAERAAEVASVRARAERFGTEMPKIVQEWDAQQERKAERERKAAEAAAVAAEHEAKKQARLARFATGAAPAAAAAEEPAVASE